MKTVTPDQLDAHVRDIVQWHVSPETGTPFWLDFARKLDWDPLKDIQTYQDLDRFGFFQDEWLRGGPVRRWVPKGYAAREARPTDSAVTVLTPEPIVGCFRQGYSPIVHESRFL